MSHVIRLCTVDEYDLLVDFIRKEWREDHIFTHDKELLFWQHREGDHLNFVVAHNPGTNEFDAILGFIPNSRFDSELDSTELWLAIWKVKEKAADTGIGLKLMLYINDRYKPASIGVLGISDDAFKIYKAFRYKTGSLDHYYIKNDQFSEFHIAEFMDRKTTATDANCTIGKINIEQFRTADLNFQYHPAKSKNYFENRYHNFEYYDYGFYGIFQGAEVIGVFIAREVEAEGSKCLRIVDWIGQFGRNLYPEFQKLLMANECEYVDLLCHVPDEEKILACGFMKKDPGKEIVPNYFEPFMKQNIDVRFAYKSKYENYAVFKADSDQDRPNATRESDE